MVCPGAPRRRPQPTPPPTDPSTMRTLCFHPCATAAMRDRAHRIANEMATERGALPDKLFVEDLCLEVESAGLGDAHILQRGSFISVVVQDIPLLTWYPGITEALPKAAPKADHHSPITVAQAAIRYRYNQKTLRTYQHAGILPEVLTPAVMCAFIASLANQNRRERGIPRDRAAASVRMRERGTIRIVARATPPPPAPLVRRAPIAVRQRMVQPRPARSTHRYYPRTGILQPVGPGAVPPRPCTGLPGLARAWPPPGHSPYRPTGCAPPGTGPPHPAHHALAAPP